jgi:hypothetical protein
LRRGLGIVFPKAGLIMPNFGVALRNDSPDWLTEHRFTPGFVDFDNEELLAREGALHPARRIRRPVLVLCHAYHRNYAHWLFDCLPWLTPWLRDLRDNRLAILLPPLLGSWQRSTLDLLGVPGSAVIEAREKSLLCADMIVPGMIVEHSEECPPTELGTATAGLKPTPPWWPRAWPTFVDPPFVETIGTLRAAACLLAGADRPDRIYVSRRGLESFRTMQNEHEVEAALARIGFAIVHPQDHSFADQVAMFSRARIVVGPHGAGLTNTAFAPKGCLVIDILPDSWSTSWMFRLTQRFEHHYLPIMYPSDPELSSPLLLGDVEIGRSHVYRVPANAFVSVAVRAMRALNFNLDCV